MRRIPVPTYTLSPGYFNMTSPFQGQRTTTEVVGQGPIRFRLHTQTQNQELFLKVFIFFNF